MRILFFVSRVSSTVVLLVLAGTPAEAQWWTVQTSGLDTNLRAVSAAWSRDAKGEAIPVVWVSGSNGVILRSINSGKTWKRLIVKDGGSLDFRGIAARDADVAYILSVGSGDKSRIYKTADGGATWKLQFSGTRKEVFLDALVCYTDVHCFALGDPIDGKFLLLETTDGDEWQELPGDNMPAALPNEGAFAASNSCLAVHGPDIYFGTGGAATARVFHSPDFGRTWAVSDTPIASGSASSGIFSIDAHWTPYLLVVGGDYKEPQRAAQSAAISRDGGKTWELSDPLPGGFRSGVSVVNDSIAVAAGPSGEDMGTLVLGWKHTDSFNLNAVNMLDRLDGWAVGPKGTIARFRSMRTYTDALTGYQTRQLSSSPGLPPQLGPASSTTCCLPGLAWLSTLTRSLQSDFMPLPPAGGVSASAAMAGGSSPRRQDANYLH